LLRIVEALEDYLSRHDGGLSGLKIEEHDLLVAGTGVSSITNSSAEVASIVATLKAV
jgi:hypothetical protein